MSLSMFNHFCQNVLKLVGARVVSLRITLNNIIGGWSLVSSSLRCHQTILLQRLHLINIKPHEFDKLLRSSVIRQLHTLLVDITEHNPFNYQVVEGAYLAKVCSQLPVLKICRLPFNFRSYIRDRLSKYSVLPPLMTLPYLSNTTHLRTLSIGINTSRFLERLLVCVPFIENLSVGVYDSKKYENDNFSILKLPVAVNTHLLRRLFRLSLNCLDNRSFHRAIALLSSVFGQLTHLSLKLEMWSSVSDPFVVSGDTIQQLCIDRLIPCATYTLNLLLTIKEDLEEKVILNSFFKAAFTYRKRPAVIIQENSRFSCITSDTYSFFVYTVPYNGTILETSFFSENLQISSQIAVNGVKLFPYANELFIEVCERESRLIDLSNCRSSISLLVPWSSLKKISIENNSTISPAQLASILKSAYNIHTLEINDEDSNLVHALLNNEDNLGTIVNRQIQSLHLMDWSLAMSNMEDFCTLLTNQLPNLKDVSFAIFKSFRGLQSKLPHTVVDQNESSKYIVNLVRFLVDHLQQLVSLSISFKSTSSSSPCFPPTIRRQLYEWPLNRSYRLRCSFEEIQIWL
ncbi:unnamed protein product [Rotaria sordida]|uniref:Uncharacterized protein n=1 Tax=Rotaria sordida TaxID=392033 RepID=A0A814GCY7_9BILA|nr:unnamed protein product [Rotaria sordida]CAF3610422.1 unnamed protein product [Rotaria sordida]